MFSVMRAVLGPESVAAALKATTSASKSKSKVGSAPAENPDSASASASASATEAKDGADASMDEDGVEAVEPTEPPSVLTLSADAREALSRGLQLHLVTLLDESLRQSRRRRNRSANSSYGTLLQLVLPSRHSQNPELYPLPEASTSMAMLFGPNMKFELSQQEQAAAAELRRINKEFEEGLVADVTADDGREAVTGKRKLDADGSGPSVGVSKRWFEKEVCFFYLQYKSY